ncbi:MAG TPA: tripartite tricarboxylate transporter substrate-binding protein, partial [Burkholderiales bacterium]
MVIPLSPGGFADVPGRILAGRLSAELGKTVYVENRPGAGGTIGADVVAKSPADGYTLLAASSGPISIMPSLQKLQYEPQKDFVLISLITRNPYALV